MRVLTFILALVLGFNASTFATATNAPVQEDKMVAIVLLMDDGDDKKVVATIFTNLMSAQKVAGALNIEMVSSDDPVTDDVFIFTLKSEEQKEVAMKMFDEEGYQLAANRVLQVSEGNNYRALNVNSLEDGTYIFQISDENGGERTKKVTIKRD